MADKNRSPKMMTIREVAKTGILTEYALRKMMKQGTLPCIVIGSKTLVNYDKLVELLDSL